MGKSSVDVRTDDISLAQTWTFLCVGIVIASGALYAAWSSTPPDTIANDVYYYWFHVSDVSAYGFGHVLIEYPLPAAVFLWLPTLVVSTFPAYFNLFWITSGLVCALISILLTFALPTRRAGLFGAFVWLATLVAAGPLGLFRFDLLPGLVVMLAVLSLARGRAGWSVFIGLGVGLKLWPIVALPFGLTGIRPRRRELLAFLGTGLVLAGGSLLIAGWDRLISPLTWQGVRGLHIESVLASWILVARLVGADQWTAELSDNNSVDFFGPGVAGTLVVGTVVQVLFFAAWMYLAWRFWRSGTKSVAAVALATTATILLLLATNKVFSPQYILWLLPVAAAAMALCFQDRLRVPRWWIPALIYLALMTQLTYPTFYGMIFSGASPQAWIGTLGLVSRNLLLVALAVSVYRRALSASQPVPLTEGKNL